VKNECHKNTTVRS